MKPALVFYTDSLVPANRDGVSFAVVIFIRTAKRDDRGLLEHEYQHSRMFWRSLGFSALRYVLSKASKFKQEVECYKVQLKVTSEDRGYGAAQTEALAGIFAGFISTRYGLAVTKEDALKALLT